MDIREVNRLHNIRAGYAVQSPQGATLFEEDDYEKAVLFAKEDSRRWIQPVLLSEQAGRTCQLPIPNGWTTHKDIMGVSDERDKQALQVPA